MHTFFNRSTQKTCETRGYRTYYYRDKLGSKTGSLSCLFSILCIDITHIKPWQTDLKVDASQRKFAKPEVAYGLAMGGQTDSQVAKSRKFHTYTVDLRSTTCFDLRWVAKQWKTSVASTNYVSGWPNETQFGRKSKSCVDLRRHASPLARAYCNYRIANTVLHYLLG